MSALDDFAKRRKQAAKLLVGLADALEPLGAGDGIDADHLRNTASRALEGRFQVLLLGCFSSGKSTLLNALLGRPVLPVKVNPCTAILTEVVYGDPPDVQVHHHDGTVDTLTPAAFTDAYQLRTADQASAGAETEDRFGHVERAVVRWPLELLQNGVVLVDTPGLDDDPTRTARTLSSLPDADAVIVVLSAARFLTELERRTLRRDLLPLGLTNLFFPVTMVDLLDALTDDPAAARAAMDVRATELLGPLCAIDGEDRLASRYFPLNARGGLHARWDRAAKAAREPIDDAALEASGVAEFEASLQQFLVHERGAAQLAHLAGVVALARDSVERRAKLDRATAADSIESLRERQTALEPQLKQLSAIAERVGRTVDDFIVRQQAIVWQDLRNFLAETEAELPDAVASFDLGGLAGLDLLRRRGRSRVEAILRTQLEAWLEQRVADWQASLRPQIELALWDLRKEIAGDAADFEALSQQIVTDFAGGSIAVPLTREDRPEVDPLERWFSVAVGAIMLSPGAVAAGWTNGYEGAMRGAASRLGIRLTLLTLGALLGPVGWAGLLLYAISDAVLLVLTGGGQLRRLKHHVSDALQGQLVQQADDARAEIEAQVAAGLAPLRDALVSVARDEATALAQTLDQTVVTREQLVMDAKDRSRAFDVALAQFDAAQSTFSHLQKVNPRP